MRDDDDPNTDELARHLWNELPWSDAQHAAVCRTPGEAREALAQALRDSGMVVVADRTPQAEKRRRAA